MPFNETLIGKLLAWTMAQLPCGGERLQPLQVPDDVHVVPSRGPPTHFFGPWHVPPDGQSVLKAHVVDALLLHTPRHDLPVPPPGATRTWTTRVVDVVDDPPAVVVVVDVVVLLVDVVVVRAIVVVVT